MSVSGVCLVIPIALGSLPVRRTRFGRVGEATRLSHCLRFMCESSRHFDAVVVSVAEAHRADARSILAHREFDGVQLVVAPDPGSRADCVRAGVEALPTEDTAVLVHDLSRPLASSAVRNRVLDALLGGNAAAAPGLVVPALVVVDSVKAVDGHGTVVATVDRTLLRSAQYPRALSAELFREVLASAPGPGVLDEVAVALSRGIPITTVAGDSDGFEVSNSDQILTEAILWCRLQGRR